MDANKPKDTLGIWLNRLGNHQSEETSEAKECLTDKDKAALQDEDCALHLRVYKALGIVGNDIDEIGPADIVKSGAQAFAAQTASCTRVNSSDATQATRGTRVNSSKVLVSLTTVRQQELINESELVMAIKGQGIEVELPQSVARFIAFYRAVQSNGTVDHLPLSVTVGSINPELEEKPAQLEADDKAQQNMQTLLDVLKIALPLYQAGHLDKNGTVDRYLRSVMRRSRGQDKIRDKFLQSHLKKFQEAIKSENPIAALNIIIIAEDRYNQSVSSVRFAKVIVGVGATLLLVGALLGMAPTLPAALATALPYLMISGGLMCITALGATKLLKNRVIASKNNLNTRSDMNIHSHSEHAVAKSLKPNTAEDSSNSRRPSAELSSPLLADTVDRSDETPGP